MKTLNIVAVLALSMFALGTTTKCRAENYIHIGLADKVFATNRIGITIDAYAMKLVELNKLTGKHPLTLSIGGSVFQRRADDWSHALIGLQINLSYGRYFVGLNYNDTRSGDVKFITGIKVL